MLDHDDAPLSDSAADLHIEEAGWLPGERDADDRLMSRETADKTIVFLLGVMAGGVAFACALCATAAAAAASAAVLLGVWVVALVVWMLWS